MPSVWVFPGQGSQRKGMGEGLFERYPHHVAEADAVLGRSLRTLCLDDPDGLLDRTDFTQPALFAVSALSFLARRDDGAALPDFYAGHSLGEFNALFAADAFDFATGVALVARRGALMAQAPRGAMAAVIGPDIGRVLALLETAGFDDVDIANINSASQIVISGLEHDIAGSERVFTDAGARFIRLNVSGAFHSRWMREIQAQFGEFAAGMSLRPLQADVISNRTARPHARDAYLPQLIEQISHPVNWYESMSWLLARGEVNLEEIGPGTTLTGLFAKIRKNPIPIAEGRHDRLGEAAVLESVVRESEAPAVATASPAQRMPGPRPVQAPRTVFMFSGQGSQYYGMGRELYATDATFRAAFDDCNRIYHDATGRDMLAELHDPANKWREMTDILLSNPALYSIGYSLNAAMEGAGIRADAVLGYSLGEYVAATVSGAIAHEDALRLTIRLAKLIHAGSAKGGMLSVLAPLAHFSQRPDLYRDTALGSINFDRNFVISGSTAAIDEAARRLSTESIVSARLPLLYPFHSPQIASLEAAFLESFGDTPVGEPAIVQYSPARAGRLSCPDAAHFWRVTRDPVNFRDAVEAIAGEGDCRFVDLSPTGTLSVFIKYVLGNRVDHVVTMNQFGRNAETFAAAVARLRPETMVAGRALQAATVDRT
jgi:malonyl CoA-acyl carrier protein transacylase